MTIVVESMLVISIERPTCVLFPSVTILVLLTATALVRKTRDLKRSAINNVIIRFAIVGFAALSVQSSCANENGRFRYSTVLQIVQLHIDDIPGADQKTIRFSIRSRNPDVTVDRIRLRMKTRSGLVPIPLEADGTFHLPITKKLASEDPWIVANQPKGTLILKATLAVDFNVAPEQRNGEWCVGYASLFPTRNLQRRVDNITGTIAEVHEVKTTVRAVNAVRIKCRDVSATAFLRVDGKKVALPAIAPGEFRVAYDPNTASKMSWIVVSRPDKWSVIPQIIETVNTNQKREKAEQSDAVEP